MRTLPARRLALASLVLALVWICSCSEDESCPTCPKPTACPDPGKALPGIWEVFESFVSGDPDQLFVGALVGFMPHDSLLIAVPGMGVAAYRWVANDSTILMTAMSGGGMFLFHYEFDADTLIMEESVSLDVYWKLIKYSGSRVVKPNGDPAGLISWRWQR